MPFTHTLFTGANKEQLLKLGAIESLQSIAVGGSDKVVSQCKRALVNLGGELPTAAAGGSRHK